jgi:hypothetical protein
VRRHPWRLLGALAPDELPHRNAMMRANEFLGPQDRRVAQFLGLHGAGTIEVRAWDRWKQRTVSVAYGDYVTVEFNSNELVRADYTTLSRVEVRFARPVPERASVQRRRLFDELLKQPSNAALNSTEAKAAALLAHPEAASLFDPGKHKDFRAQLRREWREVRSARGTAK